MLEVAELASAPRLTVEGLEGSLGVDEGAEPPRFKLGEARALLVQEGMPHPIVGRGNLAPLLPPARARFARRARSPPRAPLRPAPRAPRRRRPDPRRAPKCSQRQSEALLRRAAPSLAPRPAPRVLPRRVPAGPPRASFRGPRLRAGRRPSPPSASASPLGVSPPCTPQDRPSLRAEDQALLRLFHSFEHFPCACASTRRDLFLPVVRRLRPLRARLPQRLLGGARLSSITRRSQASAASRGRAKSRAGPRCRRRGPR